VLQTCQILTRRGADVFEAVEVENTHCETLSTTFRVGGGLTHPVIDQDPVGQFRQGIARGEMVQLIRPSKAGRP
jgi:hypothetical protein